MDRTEFHFDRRAIKRRMAISGSFTVLGLAAIPLFIAPPIYWLIAVCLVLAGVNGYRFVCDVILLWKGAPAITISDDGIQDAMLGNTLVPWAAIQKILVTRAKKKFGGSLFLIAERAQVPGNPGLPAIRAANLVIGALRRPEAKQMVLLLTPSAILEATTDAVLEAIEAREPAAGIPVERTG